MDEGMIRQGDILLVPRQAMRPGRAVPDEAGRLVLAHGEVTGHHHSFAMGDRVALFREDGAGGGLFASVTGGAPAMLEHQEHTALAVAPGLYQVVRQRTYQGGLVQRVAD